MIRVAERHDAARGDDGDGGLHALVVQILEEVGELHGGEHALVGDGACGQ